MAITGSKERPVFTQPSDACVQECMAQIETSLPRLSTDTVGRDGAGAGAAADGADSGDGGDRACGDGAGGDGACGDGRRGRCFISPDPKRAAGFFNNVSASEVKEQADSYPHKLQVKHDDGDRRAPQIEVWDPQQLQNLQQMVRTSLQFADATLSIGQVKSWEHIRSHTRVHTKETEIRVRKMLVLNGMPCSSNVSLCHL
jgi:hypothetical protein